MAMVGVRLTLSGRLRYVDDGGLDPGVGERVEVVLDCCPEPREAVVAVAAGQVILSQVAATSGRVVSAAAGEGSPPGPGPSRPRE